MTRTIRTHKTGVRNATKILGRALSLFSPLLALPFIFHEIGKGNRHALTLLAIFMSLCAILSPPFADLYRHGQEYASYQVMADIPYVQSNGKDYVLYTLLCFFAKNGIPFEWVRALFTFVCYYVSFALYKSVVKENARIGNDRRLQFLVFLCFFLSVPFIWIVNGLRSATASYLMIFAWLQIHRGKSLRSIPFALLSVWTHFFSWVFIPFLLAYKIRKLRISRFYFIAGAVVIAVAGATLLTSVMDSSFFDAAEETGFSESSKALYMENLNYSTMSSNGFIALFLERMPLLVLVAFAFLRCDKWTRPQEQAYFRLLLLLLAAVLPFFIPTQRLSWTVCPILLYLFLKNSDRHILGKAEILAGATVVSQLSYMYGYREVLFATPYTELLLPVWISLTHSYPLNFSL